MIYNKGDIHVYFRNKTMTLKSLVRLDKILTALTDQAKQNIDCMNVDNNFTCVNGGFMNEDGTHIMSVSFILVVLWYKI